MDVPRHLQKYLFYEASVIDPEHDMKVMSDIYKNIYGKNPYLYREDFCGTFAHSNAWVQAHPKNEAWALDIDPEPLEFGRRFHFDLLPTEQKKRLHVVRKNVLRPFSQQVDFVSAVNFSYFFFKDRNLLRNYFKKVFLSLKPKGAILLDLMGGPALQAKGLDRHYYSTEVNGKKMNFIYFWHQKDFNPLTHEAFFSIHFQLAGSKKIMRNVFNYDWRIWTAPELQEVLKEAGFQHTFVYVEGNDRSGHGNGIFTERRPALDEDVWIAYVAGAK